MCIPNVLFSILALIPEVWNFSLRRFIKVSLSPTSGVVRADFLKPKSPKIDNLENTRGGGTP